MSASKNPFQFFNRETNRGAALRVLGNGLVAGRLAQTILTFSGVAVDRETLTVDDGGDAEQVFEVVDIATDSTFDALTDFNNTAARITAERAGHTFAIGDYLAIETELMLVRAVDGDKFTVDRGEAGTTIAAHATGTDPINERAATALTAGATTVPSIGVAATDVLSRLAAILAEKSGDWDLTKLSTTVGLIRSKTAGDKAVDVTETFTNATVVPGTTYNGRDQAVTPVYFETRVPTADEVTAGVIYFSTPFPAAQVAVEVRTTATDAVVAWDGAVDWTNKALGVISIDNGGVTDWAATDTVHLVVYGEPIVVADAEPVA